MPSGRCIYTAESCSENTSGAFIVMERVQELHIFVFTLWMSSFKKYEVWLAPSLLGQRLLKVIFTENEHPDNVQQPLVLFIGECYLPDRKMPNKSTHFHNCDLSFQIPRTVTMRTADSLLEKKQFSSCLQWYPSGNFGGIFISGVHLVWFHWSSWCYFS